MFTRLPDRPWGRMWIVHHHAKLRWWIKVIHVYPGRRTSLQYHRHRSELHVSLDRWRWSYVPVRRWHRMIGGWYLEFAWGRFVSETDIVRTDDDYGRQHTSGC